MVMRKRFDATLYVHWLYCSTWKQEFLWKLLQNGWLGYDSTNNTASFSSGRHIMSVTLKRQTTDCGMNCVAHRKWRDTSCLRCASATRLALQSLPQSQVLQTLNIPISYLAECNWLKQGYYSIVASLFVVYSTAIARTKLQKLCCVKTYWIT